MGLRAKNFFRIALRLAIVLPISLLYLNCSKFSSSLTGAETGGTSSKAPPIGLDTVAIGIGVDYATVKGAPLIKSKIGFLSNIGNNFNVTDGKSDLVTSLPYLDDIGPGFFCTSIDFDHYYKFDGNGFPNPAVDEVLDSNGKPIELKPTPTDFLRNYEAQIAAGNIRLVHEIMGGPAQYQPANVCKPAIHPAPLNIPAAAALMAQWAQSSNHAAPILWQIWNEPGHTLNQSDRGLDSQCNCLVQLADGSCKKEAQAEYDARLLQQRNDVSILLNDLYAKYDAAMRPLIGDSSSIGLASFLDGDFQPDKLVTNRTQTGEILFSAFWNYLFSGPAQADFVSFNSFNGKWRNSFDGARSVLGARSTAPMSLTQYAPAILGLPADASFAYLNNTNRPNNIQSLMDTMTDLSGLYEDTDVDHVCMGNWLSNKLGFVTADNAGVVTTNLAYAVFLQLSRMPTLQLSMKGTIGYTPPADPNQIDQIVRGLHGFTTASQTQVVTLLWNDALSDSSSRYEIINLPAKLENSLSAAKISTWVGTSGNGFSASTQTVDLIQNRTITIPAQSVVLVSVGADLSSSDEPALRRNSLTFVDGTGASQKPLFLKSQFNAYRASALKCSPFVGVDACYKSTGSQGSFDGVRHLFNLVIGSSSDVVTTSANFSNLPDEIYLNLKSVANWDLNASTGNVRVEVQFPGCAMATPIKLSLLEAGDGSVVDPLLASGRSIKLGLSQAAGACWSTSDHSAIIKISAEKMPVGLQVEGGISATLDLADKLSRRLGTDWSAE